MSNLPQNVERQCRAGHFYITDADNGPGKCWCGAFAALDPVPDEPKVAESPMCECGLPESDHYQCPPEQPAVEGQCKAYRPVIETKPLLIHITGRELIELQKSMREAWDKPSCKRVGVCCYPSPLSTAECVFCGKPRKT